MVIKKPPAATLIHPIWSGIVRVIENIFAGGRSVEHPEQAVCDIEDAGWNR
jgi:hypothetical protein